MKFACLLVAVLWLSGCATTQQSDFKQAKVDRISVEQLEALMPPRVAHVSLESIVADSQQGLPAQTIIEKIKASQSHYDLTPQQYITLNQQGVDVAVLDHMHQADQRVKQNAIADEMNRQQQLHQQKQQQLEHALQMERFRYFNHWPRFGLYYGHPYRRWPYRSSWPYRFYR